MMAQTQGDPFAAFNK